MFPYGDFYDKNSKIIKWFILKYNVKEEQKVSQMF